MTGREMDAPDTQENRVSDFLLCKINIIYLYSKISARIIYIAMVFFIDWISKYEFIEYFFLTTFKLKDLA